MYNTVLQVIPVCSDYMIFLSGMIVCQNINMIFFDIFQSKYNIVFQYNTVCTVHVHKNKNINFKTVFKYHTLCTMQISHENNINVSTNFPVHAQSFIFHYVLWHLTATNIDLVIYFNECLFVTPSLWDEGTSTTILFSVFRFFH